MADSQQEIDWTAVRQAALDCLDATGSLICHAESSQEDDYNADRAALHLAAIDTARDTFKRTAIMLSRGLFDSLALASVGEGPRPDFRFGVVCCATAHETAHELLRRTLGCLESGVFDELKGIDGLHELSLEALHELSLEALRNTLSRLEERTSLRGLVDAPGLHQVGAWIDREWAAVLASGKPAGDPPKLLDGALDHGALGADAIAEKYGMPLNALRNRLTRWKERHPEEDGRGFFAVSSPKPGEPQYLYRVSAVWEAIKDLAGKATAGTATG